MKFNWGTGIALFYTLFVLVLVFVVIKSRGVDHSLVMEDYYQKDLEYQSQIDKEVNTQNLLEDLKITFSDPERTIRLQFPEGLGVVHGTALFFRPSNKALDFEVPIQANETGEQLIPTRDMLPGLWKVKVNWNAGGKEYYKEDTIIF
ncbi:MAG: FixH family protein [Saprospirales bacterium]|nr:FixH family protein [Saprospirales bacterium]MBK8489751.1 FixH family protein [Saprospirales bacterium]